MRIQHKSFLSTPSRIVAGALIAVSLSAGCSGGDSGTDDSGKSGSGSSPATQAFPQEDCLRKLGIEFAVTGEGKSIPDKQKNTPAEISSAVGKCQGSSEPTISAAELAELREQAACMRKAGITEFQDPTDTGEAVPDDALEKKLETEKGKKALIDCGITAANPGSDPGEEAG